MYYLLEDNRIVDRLSIKEDLDLPFEVDFYVQKDEIVLTIDHAYFEHISIIKKSENILELIEVGDVIKIDSDLTREQLTLGSGVYEVMSAKRLPSGEWKIKTNADGNDINGDWYEFFPETLIAIYKLDDKGNYIKVWEDR